MTALANTIKTHLNLSILQEFKIQGIHNHFRFTEDGLEVQYKNKGSYSWYLVSKEIADGNLSLTKGWKLITLEALIIHPDWILPDTSKTYYCWKDNHKLHEYPWSGSLEDLEHYASGNCFSSKKEAKAKLAELEDKLTSIYYGGKSVQGVLHDGI